LKSNLFSTAFLCLIIVVIASCGGVDGYLSGLNAEDDSGGASYLKTFSNYVAASNSSEKAKALANMVCDGVDDQAEINRAISNTEEGGLVVLASGTYNISSSIRLSSGITLMGEGSGTLLKVADDIDKDVHVIVNDSPVGGNSDMTVKDLRLDGNMANRLSGNQTGIYFQNVARATIQDIRITDFSFFGILLEGGGYNKISGVHGYDTEDNIITLHGSSNNVIEGNILTHARASVARAILLYDGADNNIINGNICSHNGDEGILILGGNSNIVTNNQCSGNGDQGIEINGAFLGVTGADHNVIAGNVCSDNGTDGITLNRDSRFNLINDNQCMRNVARGIAVFKASDNLLNGNACVANGRSNIFVGSDFTLTASYNSLIGNLLRIGDTENFEPIYGIQIYNEYVNGTIAGDNDLFNSGTDGEFHDAGTGTLYDPARYPHESWVNFNHKAAGTSDSLFDSTFGHVVAENCTLESIYVAAGYVPNAEVTFQLLNNNEILAEVTLSAGQRSNSAEGLGIRLQAGDTIYPYIAPNSSNTHSHIVMTVRLRH